VVRKIVEAVPEDLLQQDLERYRRRAIELGATDAKIITTDMVLVDERVRAKCIVPLCSSYGACLNCPPHAIDLDLMRKVVRKFQYALFYMLKLAPEEVTGPEYKAKRMGIPSTERNYKIAATIESEAFYDGYYLAMAFINASCKQFLCPDEDCSALVRGQGCRHPLIARHSMEGAGMDAYLMTARVGWDIYPVGTSAPLSAVPHGTRLGLVLIY
jgi:predicted metal-binding protein